MNKIIFLLVTFIFVACTAQNNNSHAKLLPPKAFEQKMKDDKGPVIDVRTPKEFHAGHIENAVNMHVYDKDFDKRIDGLDKEQPVYVYCKVGGRSSEAVEILEGKGFKNIVELEGGIDAWLDAGKPTRE